MEILKQIRRQSGFGVFIMTCGLMMEDQRRPLFIHDAQKREKAAGSTAKRKAPAVNHHARP